MSAALQLRTVDPVMVEFRAASFTRRSIKASSKLAMLRLALSMLDLTTLEGKDTPEKVRSLCRKAVRPFERDEEVLGERLPPAAAVCVYPSMVPHAREALERLGGGRSDGGYPRIASVATGFPSGQYPLAVRLADARDAVLAGADEIDMVINRGAFLAGRYGEVAAEIREVKAAMLEAAEKAAKQPAAAGERRSKTAIGDVASDAMSNNGEVGPHRSALSTQHSALPPRPILKVILETGELETYDNARRASDLAIEALHAAGGAHGDYIKTSTGKVTPAATMPVTLVMLQAIRDHFLATGEVVGCKPAGGIRAAKQAVHYLVMVHEEMGGLRGQESGVRTQESAAGDACPWLTPEFFRFGASTLTNDILRQVVRLKTGHYPAAYDFSEA